MTYTYKWYDANGISKILDNSSFEESGQSQKVRPNRPPLIVCLKNIGCKLILEGTMMESLTSKQIQLLLTAAYRTTYYLNTKMTTS